MDQRFYCFAVGDRTFHEPLLHSVAGLMRYPIPGHPILHYTLISDNSHNIVWWWCSVLKALKTLSVLILHQLQTCVQTAEQVITPVDSVDHEVLIDDSLHFEFSAVRRVRTLSYDFTKIKCT